VNAGLAVDGVKLKIIRKKAHSLVIPSSFPQK
jgi:hypothetical protein